jgi:single-stranded-DNA-specific exonuclease
LFDGEFDIASTRAIGEAHLRLKLRPCGGTTVLDAMLFNAERCGPLSARIRAAFQLEIDEWDGAQSLRLLLRHVEPL